MFISNADFGTTEASRVIMERGSAFEQIQRQNAPKTLESFGIVIRDAWARASRVTRPNDNALACGQMSDEYLDGTAQAHPEESVIESAAEQLDRQADYSGDSERFDQHAERPDHPVCRNHNRREHPNHRLVMLEAQHRSRWVLIGQLIDRLRLTQQRLALHLHGTPL